MARTHDRTYIHGLHSRLNSRLRQLFVSSRFVPAYLHCCWPLLVSFCLLVTVSCRSYRPKKTLGQMADHVDNCAVRCAENGQGPPVILYTVSKRRYTKLNKQQGKALLAWLLVTIMTSELSCIHIYVHVHTDSAAPDHCDTMLYSHGKFSLNYLDPFGRSLLPTLHVILHWHTIFDPYLWCKLMWHHYKNLSVCTLRCNISS